MSKKKKEWGTERIKKSGGAETHRGYGRGKPLRKDIRAGVKIFLKITKRKGIHWCDGSPDPTVYSGVRAEKSLEISERTYGGVLLGDLVFDGLGGGSTVGLINLNLMNGGGGVLRKKGTGTGQKI